MKKYAISFGDSDKYIVTFQGSKEEFENSDKLRVITDRVKDYLKETFPTGGYADAIELNIEDGDGKDYEDLETAGIDALLKSVKRQVEVLREGEELNNNAPFDQL